MRVIPVIDLKQGQVVQAIAGRRHEYAAIQSCLVDGSDPGKVAVSLHAAFGFSDVYVADLDAIQGGEPDWQSLQAIAKSGMNLWLDAGVQNAERALRVAERGWLPVVGLETILGIDELDRLLELITHPERIVFSLDLRGGNSIARHWSTCEPLEIVQQLFDRNVRKLIVLDLQQVGLSAGTGTRELCRQIQSRWSFDLFSGGGVASTDDLRALQEDGCTGALVATALHRGTITAQMLQGSSE